MGTDVDGEAKSRIKKEIARLADYHYDNHYEISLSRALSSNLASFKIRSIPQDISLMITHESGNVFLGENHKENYVSRCKTFPIEDWDHEYSLKTFCTKMSEVIKKLEKSIKNIEFDNVDSDGDHFDVWYNIKFDEGVTIKDVVAYITNLEKELVGYTEIMLTKDNIKKRVLKNEEEFALNVLLPLFRSMGYLDVQYNHGPKEFGKDITFSDIDKMGIRRNFGVQAKAGNLTGEASSELDHLIDQIDDALKMSFMDIYSKERRRITDLIIAISGKFTGNAPQKICEKIPNENVHFLDVDKIRELLTKYMNTQIE